MIRVDKLRSRLRECIRAQVDPDPPVRRRRRHLHRRRGVRRDDRRAQARQDADHAAAARHRHRERRRQGRRSQFQAARLFLHGTTVAINTILERSGARCALLTTQGFRDIYEIGRVNRPESYNLFFQQARAADRPRPALRDHASAWTRRAAVLIPLDEEQVRAVVAARGRAGRARRSRSCSCTRTAIRRTSSAPRRSSSRSFRSCSSRASHELSQEYREYERTSTAAANAYVGPRVRHYLTEMESISTTRASAAIS